MGIKTTPAHFAVGGHSDGSDGGPAVTPRDAGLEEGCLEKLQPGDRFFSVICTDKLAPQVIRYWAILAREAGVNKAKVENALAQAADLQVWQEAHPERLKLPD